MIHVHHRHHRAVMVVPYQPQAGTLHSIMLQGGDPQCGFQCCCFHLYGTGKTCMATTSLPPELDGFVTLEELNEFKSRINSIFDETAYPMMPGLCTHFCIPFSPICCMLYWAGRRNSLIAELVSKTNERLSGKGLQWQVIPVNNNYVMAGAPFCVLKSNNPQHAACFGGMVPPQGMMMQPAFGGAILQPFGQQPNYGQQPLYGQPQSFGGYPPQTQLGAAHYPQPITQPTTGYVQVGQPITQPTTGYVQVGQVEMAPMAQVIPVKEYQAQAQAETLQGERQSQAYHLPVQQQQQQQQQRQPVDNSVAAFRAQLEADNF